MTHLERSVAKQQGKRHAHTKIQKNTNNDRMIMRDNYAFLGDVPDAGCGATGTVLVLIARAGT